MSIMKRTESIENQLRSKLLHKLTPVSISIQCRRAEDQEDFFNVKIYVRSLDDEFSILRNELSSQSFWQEMSKMKNSIGHFEGN
jgi:hypothetical protein